MTLSERDVLDNRRRNIGILALGFIISSCILGAVTLWTVFGNSLSELSKDERAFKILLFGLLGLGFVIILVTLYRFLKYLAYEHDWGNCIAL